MTSTLIHRGPDDSGIWFDASLGIALGHRRLSVIDLSPLGHQPMVSDSGRYVISYNGEVYNFRELAKELEGQGKKFRGHSDTEVILAAIECFGIGRAIRRFVGMFAFALWDCHEKELFLVRDRVGIKPVYWAQFGEIFLFGSELKALRACPDWSPELDRNALASFMRWNYVPAPMTIYRDVSKLEAGSFLRLSSNGTVSIERYWDPVELAVQGLANRIDGGTEDCVNGLGELLEQAVAQRMMSDVPLGAFLSGGIDSSLVVALMQAQNDKPVRTFTIGFGDSIFDESEYARNIATHLRTDHTEHRVEPRDALDLIPQIPDIYDEPFADSSQIPTYLVSQMTRQKVTVALSGDGGDELFGGYTRYYWAERMWRAFGAVPWMLRLVAGRGLSSIPPSLWDSISSVLPPQFRLEKAGERAVKLGAFLSKRNADAIYWCQHSQWEFPGELVRGVHTAADQPNEERLRKSLPDFVERMQLADLATYLPGDILTKVDQASMAVGLEVRVPILDHRVVEYAWRLPAEMKYRDGDAKWALRQLLYRYVPRKLVDRPKSGFSVPIAAWLRGPLRDWAESLLDELRLDQEGILAATPIKRAWQQLLEGKDWQETPIWCVLMFLAWHEKHL